MSITVPMYGFGGGSGGLNFQVIGGTTAPSNPKENMIWVNTSTKITSYIFSATQPTGSAGMVWISVGTSSPAEFNALKKNGIQVYPISAKQYVGGAWVDVTAKSHQGGEWVCWVTYLYDSGNEFIDLTGGWSARGWKRTANYVSSSEPTVNKDISSMTITTSSSTTLTSHSGAVEVGKDIDVTNASTIRAVFESVEASGRVTSDEASCLSLCVVSRNAAYYSTDAVASAERLFESAEKTDDVILECDVSNIQGTYDIVLGVCCYCIKNYTQTFTATLKSIEMK